MLMAGLSVSLDRRCSSMGLGPGSPACNPQQTPIVMLLGFPVPVDPFFCGLRFLLKTAQYQNGSLFVS